MPPKRKAATRVADEAAAAKKGKVDGEFYWDNDAPSRDVLPNVFYRIAKVPGKTKAIGFDIDWTIIQTKSGKKFATGASDWKWWDESVPKKLKELDDSGFRIVFFSNQGGIEKGKATVAELQSKVNAIAEAAGVPIFAFLSTGENSFRKPSTNTWDLFADKCNGGVKLDLKQCKYVGDAAGRAKEWAPGKPRDFSCTDRMFAANIGIQFATPENFFLGQKEAPFSWGKSVDPATLGQLADHTQLARNYAKEGQELVLMVGMPATGKSSFARRYLLPHGYQHVNRDELKTPAKCLKAATEALDKGDSVVVDNTNPSKAARAEYLAIAKKKKIPTRCFVMDVDKEMAHHLNIVRQNASGIRRIPDVGYNVFNKNYEAPTKAEGFAELTVLKFSPEFMDAKHKKYFYQWTA